MKKINRKITLICIFIPILLLINTDLTHASLGTSSNNKIRLNLNYLTYEQNTTSNFIRAFSDYIAFNVTTTNSYSRFGILNFRPSIPILNEPINDSYMKTTPELNWSNSTDPEQFSSITYIVEISDDITFPYTNYSNSSVAETANVTKDNSLTLTLDSAYYWRVMSYDQYDNSSFSEIRTFTIDTIPPTEINLTFPDNETNSTDSTPAASWQETIEINFDNYTIEFSNSSDFLTINFSFSNVGAVSNNSFSNWNSTEILSSGTWYWRVIAYDKAGNLNQTEAFTYNVGNPVEIIERESISTSIQGSGSSGGGARIQQVALDIIQPGPLSLFTNDTITTPLFITNKGGVALRNINLEALTNATNLNLELTQTNIGILLPGQTIAVDLIIMSTDDITGETQNEITVEATSFEPSIKDSAKFFINLLEFGLGERKDVLDRILILRNIIEGNPECLELQELLDQANIAMDLKQYNKALSLVEAAIQSCKNLVASLGKELVVKPSRRDTYIAIAETFAALILFSLIYRYYKRKKRSKKS